MGSMAARTTAHIVINCTPVRPTFTETRPNGGNFDGCVMERVTEKLMSRSEVLVKRINFIR